MSVYGMKKNIEVVLRALETGESIMGIASRRADSNERYKYVTRKNIPHTTKATSSKPYIQECDGLIREMKYE